MGACASVAAVAWWLGVAVMMTVKKTARGCAESLPQRHPNFRTLPWIGRTQRCSALLLPMHDTSLVH
eukprot:3217068-Amphidinium_carterae.1